jgi:hypothetical protein
VDDADEPALQFGRSLEQVMPNMPASTHQAKQSSHLAPRDEPGAWQSQKLQEGLTQRRKGAKISEALLNFAPLRLCVRLKTRPQAPRHLELDTMSWNVWMRLACVVVSSFLMTSCLKFGDEFEFLAPDVTAAHLKHIEERTCIDLPEGSVGMALYSNATGIDPWMVAKIHIPPDKVNALLASKPFEGYKLGHSTLISGADRPWWTPDQMNKPLTGDIKRSNAFVNWSLGREGEKHMLYIRWDTF